MVVIKATGEEELFNEEKLRLSIKRAGIPDSLSDEVINHIKTKLYENYHGCPKLCNLLQHESYQLGLPGKWQLQGFN